MNIIKKSFRTIFVAMAVLSLFPHKLLAINLIVVRHGQALHNVKGIFNGDLENSEKYPLTEKGQEQVKRTGKRLKQQFKLNNNNVAKIFHSPFLRTRQTAKILAHMLQIDEKKITSDGLLVDVNMGRFEETSEIQAVVLSRINKYHESAKKYGGETDDEVRQRIKAFLDKWKVADLNGDVIIVTHGTPSVELIALFNKEQKRSAELPTAGLKVIQL